MNGNSFYGTSNFLLEDDEEEEIVYEGEEVDCEGSKEKNESLYRTSNSIIVDKEKGGNEDNQYYEDNQFHQRRHTTLRITFWRQYAYRMECAPQI